MALKVKKPISSPRRRVVFKRSLLMKYFRFVFFGAALTALIFFATGCAERRLEDAFQGKFTTAKNNKVINEYCKSCHIHKTFDPGDHMGTVRSKYKSRYFRKTHECRSCHYIEKNWVTNNYHRKTRSVKKANRGAFRDFEHAQIKQMKKNGQQKK